MTNMTKIKYQRAGKLLIFLIMACITMNISAQKDESWTTFDLDEISISIPKNLDEIYLNQKTKTKGFIVHEFSPSNRIGKRGKENFFVDLFKIPNHSVEKDFIRMKNLYQEGSENVKIKKRKTQSPCDLHYTITHESVNPFSNEREYGADYFWLYKYGNDIFRLKISCYDAITINKKELLKTIYKVQSTFIIH